MPKHPTEKVTNFIEELGWLLRNYNDRDFARELSYFALIAKQAEHDTERFTPANPNIAFLVGALPGLFMSRKLFPRNEDIANFAVKVLRINVTRMEKRSQYELIGLIVCEVLKLDDSQLSAVVNELKDYVPSKNTRSSKSPMGWNEVIRRLSGETSDV